MSLGSEGSVDAWLVVAERDLVMIRKALEGPALSRAVLRSTVSRRRKNWSRRSWLQRASIRQKSHDIAMLVARLPDDHPLRTILYRLDRYTEFVGTYRYPGPGLLDAVPEEPAVDEVASWLAEIEGVKLQVVECLRTR